MKRQVVKIRSVCLIVVFQLQTRSVYEYLIKMVSNAFLIGPACGVLSRGFKMVTNCSFDNISGIHRCIVRCRPGYVLPTSLSATKFTCGISTNYSWTPMSNPPDCVGKYGKIYINAILQFFCGSGRVACTI